MSKTNEVTVVAPAEVLGAETARQLALQIGYGGALTVGTLEDEIRFYQRHTVEACLELGKRLLVLKELTPHGEFQQRLDLLGFTKQTSQRFMQAASKTAKSPNLGLLSTQVKSMSAFLELVTYDDDVLENLADLDDLDRMSASQLRAHARGLESNGAKRAKRLEAELEHRDAVIQKLKKREVQREFDPLTHMVRDECLAYQGGIELNVQSLGALFDEVIKDSPDAPEWKLRLEQIWFAAHAATARATALLQRVRDEMPVDMPEQATMPNMLTPDEVFQWVLEWETMTSQAKAVAAVRADLRAQEGPRGVGRPKGSKAAKADKA